MRRVPLVVHCGEEKAVPGAEREALGNPLAMRAPLAQGRACHRRALRLAGPRDATTERPSRPEVPAFDLFVRLMDEPAHQGLLFGDLSAVFQRNRKPGVWQAVLRRRDWHTRLLHGSDHPLPGLMPLFSLPALVNAGLLAEADVPVLHQLREHNALLFDFVLKRRLRWQGAALPAAVFEAAALAPRVASHAATVASG